MHLLRDAESRCRTAAHRQRGMSFCFQAEDGIRDYKVTGVQTCALPISIPKAPSGTTEVFPAIVGGKAGTVYLSWQDNRTGRFNTWFRSSTDGGRTWGTEVDRKSVV